MSTSEVAASANNDRIEEEEEDTQGRKKRTSRTLNQLYTPRACLKDQDKNAKKSESMRCV